jgi:hypothetical protein
MTRARCKKLRKIAELPWKVAVLARARREDTRNGEKVASSGCEVARPGREALLRERGDAQH